MAQESGRDAPAAVLVVRGQRPGPLIDTTDRASDGDVATVIEGHPITDLEFDLRGFSVDCGDGEAMTSTSDCCGGIFKSIAADGRLVWRRLRKIIRRYSNYVSKCKTAGLIAAGEL